MEYLFGKMKQGPGAAVVDLLEGVEKHYQLHQGISRAKGWPSDAMYRMNDDFPKNLKLEDFLLNMNKFLVASGRVKQFLESQKVKAVEYLPVTIVNHKGRKEKEPYYVVHPIDLQDCIDLKKAKYIPNPIDPETFSRIENVTLDRAKLDPDVQLFRMRHYPYVDVWRSDLVEKMAPLGFTGRKFVPLSELKA